MKQDLSVKDNASLDLSVGKTVYMNHEEYTINEVNINEDLGNSKLVPEPIRTSNNYSPTIKFENYDELLEKISFERPNLLIGDEVHYKGKGYTVTKFDDMRNNLKTITIKDNAEYFGGMITGSEVIAYRLESDLTRLFNLPEKEEEKEKIKDSIKDKISNFKITDEILSQTLTPSNNIEAISMLNREERELDILAQEVLAKYVGWGGLSEVFDESKTG